MVGRVSAVSQSEVGLTVTVTVTEAGAYSLLHIIAGAYTVIRVRGPASGSCAHVCTKPFACAAVCPSKSARGVCVNWCVSGFLLLTS